MQATKANSLFPPGAMHGEAGVSSLLHEKKDRNFAINPEATATNALNYRKNKSEWALL